MPKGNEQIDGDRAQSFELATPDDSLRDTEELRAHYSHSWSVENPHAWLFIVKREASSTTLLAAETIPVRASVGSVSDSNGVV
jgi:hypothetical protein